MEAILRERQVVEITGLSRTTLWRQERKGKFPKRIKLSERAVGWRKSAVLSWVEDRKIAGAE
jgi:prophage regulatory protein